MIIFLYGADDYRRLRRKKFYIDEFKKKHSGLSVGYFDLQEPGRLEELEAFLRAQPLFSAKGGSASGEETKKLAVLENLDEALRRGSGQALRHGSGRADEKKLAEALKPTVAKKATVVLASENKKPPKKLGFLVEKPAIVEEFAYLAGAEWAAFIKKEAIKRGIALSADAVNFLAEVYAKNSWGLVNELEKISNLEKKEIARADLEALGLETALNYWMTINSVKSQSLKTRLLALEKLLSQKDPPAKVFNILASFWKEKIPAMAEYDFTVKSGKLEYEEVLLDALL